MEKRQQSKIYAEYPEMPYIAPDRDLLDWEAYPEKHPYGRVPKKNMVRLSENLLPGDIIFLWRVSLDTLHTLSVMPAYFEYRYGVNWEESRDRLRFQGYIRIGSALETLTDLNMAELKHLLREVKKPLGGKKADLLERVSSAVPEDLLEKRIERRKFFITKSGEKLLSSHMDIVTEHGMKG